MSLSQRITQLIDNLGISARSLESQIGASNGVISRVIRENKDIGSKWLIKIVDNYPQINGDWLLTGKGDMIERRIYSTDIADSAVDEPASGYNNLTPYFDLPVSAGQIGQIDTSSKADKYILIPGVSCIAYFPVIGFSMEPTVKNGDIIGIDNIDSWERLDPDKIYYILTHEDRMIKRLMYDPANPEVITCYSDNYPPFTLDKSHIKAIYRVVFKGQLM